MYQNSPVDREFAIRAARNLDAAGPDKGTNIFNELLRHKQLSCTVHHLNLLLEDREHRLLAKRALHCLGLDN